MFEVASEGDVVALIEENPLAWIFVQDAGHPFATAAPVRPSVTGGTLAGLVGHVPRGRRIATCFRESCRATFLFAGPHGYISPSWMSNRAQAPTWNFTSVQLDTEVRLVDEPAFLEAHLRDLVAQQERGRTDAWTLEEIGARFETLAARVVAFEATIRSGEHRFKLGQDENDETFREILRALEGEGQAGLLRWMQRFDARD